MKQQTGLRLDSKLWAEFKQLCSQAHLRPNEAIEAFLMACSRRKSVNEVLKSLEGLNESEKIANEIRLKKTLTELDAYLAYDMKRGEAEKYSDVSGLIEDASKILPKILNQQLVSQAEAKINEALAYYRKHFEKAETPPEDIIF